MKLAVVGVLLVGLLSAGASLMVPVDVAFADDPILRLQPFEGTPVPVVTDVDCGNAFEGLRAAEVEGAPSFYALARDRACRREASRRALSAGAAAIVVVSLCLLVLAGASVGAGAGARSPRP